MTGNTPERLRGQGLVEYALLLVLVAIVVLVILAILGPAVGNIFSEILDPMPDSGGNPPGDCYSSLLIAIMVATMGVVSVFRRFLPEQLIEKVTLRIERAS